MTTSFIHAVTTRFGIGVDNQDWFEQSFAQDLIMIEGLGRDS